MITDTVPSPRLRRLIPIWLTNWWGAVGGMAAAYVLFYTAWTYFQWGARENSRLIPQWSAEQNLAFISDVAFLPVSAFAALAAWRVAANGRLDARLRRAWLILGLCIFSFFLGDLIWFYLEIVLRIDPFPSAADIFYLAFYPLALWGLLNMPSAQLSRSERLKLALDLSIVIVAAWMVVWYSIINPMTSIYPGDFLKQTLAAAYPIGDLVVLGGIVAVLFRRPEPATRSVLLLFLTGLLLFVAADLLFAYASIAETYASGGWIDVGWIVAYLCFAFAALRQPYLSRATFTERWAARVFDRLTIILPFAAIGLGYGIMLLVSRETFSSTAQLQGLYIGVALLTAFVIGRQMVTLRENILLNGELKEQIVRLDQAYELLKVEREKSERLLLNVLPEPIAVRLKQGQDVIADSFKEVTVLFADIVGFTSFSAHISPEELVTLLNEVFSTFDRLAEQYGLEKIKTVGDTYMVVSGLPKPRSDHAEAIVEMALDMRSELQRLSAQRNIPLKVRIGIDSGPVVAGVIGTKKFIYDLWGDTVNTASRMESHGLAGKIQVTQRLYEHLQGKYNFEMRGAIPVKGKGEMITYFLTGRKGERRASLRNGRTGRDQRRVMGGDARGGKAHGTEDARGRIGEVAG